MSPCNTTNFDKTIQFTVITSKFSFRELDLMYKKLLPKGVLQLLLYKIVDYTYYTPTIPLKIFNA